MVNALFLDQRLHERGLRDKHITKDELEGNSAALPDRSDNLVEFDAAGNPTNLPRRKLKSLPVKPGEPESEHSDGSASGDMLSEAWDEGPDV